MDPCRLSKLKVGTHYKVDCVRDGDIVWSTQTNNLVVNTGLQYVLGATFGNWDQREMYVGLCTNVVVSPEDTMESHQFIEYTGTSSIHRPHAVFIDTDLVDNKWTYTASNVQSMIIVPDTLRGIFMADNEMKGEDAGMLYGVAPFTDNKDVIAGDALLITITVSVEG
jgi:hypothetical protein